MKHALVAVMVSLAALASSAQAADPAQNLERDRRLIETYRSMLAEDPTQEYAFRRMLETAHVVGGVSGLVELYKAEVEKNPKSYAAWLVLGNLQRTADDIAGAREAFDKAAALQPGRGEPYLLIAAMHRDKREFPEAFAAYDKGIALTKDRAAKQDALRAAGEAAVEAKDGPKAEAYFDKMAETEPGNLFLRMQGAGALARLEKPDLALAKWLEIETKAGGNLQHLVVIWKEIAELQTQLGRFGDAEATWRKGLERLPSTHYERRTFLDGLVSVHRRDDRLRELITELTPKAERDVELTLVVARLHEELAEDEEALRYYREAQKRKPGDEEPRMAALGILERIGRPDEILQAWAELVKAFPREPRHELKLAELYFQHNKPKDAAELLRRISRNYPNDPGVHTQVVDQWLRYGDRAARAEVENEYKILQRLEPNEPAHVMSLGEFYWSNKDTARAEATWARLVKMGKRPGEGHLMLGETYADHDQLDLAQAQFEAAIAADEDNLRYRRALALLHEKRGRGQQALAEWTRIAERGGADRTNAMTREAREHIIQIWEKSARLDSEIGELTQKFAATPPDLAAGKFLAVALLRLGRVDEAKAALERLDQLAPEDVETLAGLEQVYTRQSEPRKAIGVLERLAKANPRAAVEYMHRAAELALSMGDEASALAATKQVVALAPADANAHARVGDLYVRMGLRSEAAEAWRQALTLEPRNFPVRFKLASLYRDMGNPAREEQVLGDIVREATDSVDILRAGRRLLQLSLATGRLAEVETLLRPLIEPGRGGRGRGAQLRLVVDVYGHLAQALRFSDEPYDVRDKKLGELGERALRPLLEALEDNDVATRSRAIECLELTHPAGATPALARLAASPESMAQIEAITALGHIGTAGAVAALGRLAQGQLAQTRELALWALGFASTADATAVFREHLMRPDGANSPRDRAVIAAAIGYGRHPNAIQLAIVLSTDRSQDVREIALWALGRLRAPEAVTDIAERLARPVSVREAQIAAWGLGQIDTPEARAALIAQLWSGAPMASDDAIWMALAYAPERAARDAMIDASYSSLPARDRGLLQPMRPAMYLPEAPSDAPRANFLNDIVGAGDGPLLARIAAIVTGPDSGPKLVLADALVRQGKGRDDGLSLVPPQLGDARVVTTTLLERVADRLLTELELEGDPRVRDAWLEVLAHWQSPKVARDRLRPLALSVLTAADATAPTATVRGAMLVLASDTIGPTWSGHSGITRDALTTALAPYVASPAPEIRAALARALAAVGDGAAQSQLVQLAQDPVPFVRIAVATAIAHHKLAVDSGLVAELFDLVHDPLPDVSVAAVYALVAQNRPDLVSRLRSDPTPHIQRALRDRDTNQ